MIEADLEGLGAFIGAVDGFISAVADPRFEGDFLDHLMTKAKNAFMLDAYAAHASGSARLQHVFEWGDQDANGVATGRPSSIPLFKLTKEGAGDMRVLSFKFLPSTVPVPLPDPNKYGFKPEILGSLRRHVFVMKAGVMETQGNVTINPRWSKRLFIPWEGAKKGYVMTDKGVRVNPGGAHSTGGFTEFWTAWFGSRGQSVTETLVKKTEEELGATGRKVVRYAAGSVVGGKKVGGQFAAARGVEMGYINAKKASSQRYAERELRKYFASQREEGFDDE